MLIAGFPAGPWGTNCYVVATAPGTECVVIDPGMEATEGVAEVVRQHRLKPVSVLVTHGHVDHMWCVAPVAGAYDATAWIHPVRPAPARRPDGRACRAETAQMMLGGDYSWAEPDDVQELGDLQELELAGLRFVVDHTPGHTEGSVTFRSPYDATSRRSCSPATCSSPARSAAPTCPGGDHPTMLRSLATKVLPLADDVVVLPGHGEQTSIGRERATNPFLQDLPRRDDARRPPR